MYLIKKTKEKTVNGGDCIIKELYKEKKRIEDEIKAIEREMVFMPEGNLYCMKNRNSYQYRINGVYAGKNKSEEIRKLGTREYYEKILERMIKTVVKIDELINIYDSYCIDDVYENLSDGRKKLVTESVYKTPNQMIKDFLDCETNNTEIYEKAGMNPDIWESKYSIDTGIYTLKGEQVRSKSEKIIADALYYYEVPYKYEWPLVLADNGRKIVIHPDFTVLNNRNAKRKYVEHLGLMGEEDYFNSAMRKLSLYEKNGYLIGRDLVLFHETASQPLNTVIVNEYIEEYLL